MSARFTLVLSDALNAAIEREASETNSKSEIIRKALQLYLAAKAGERRDLKLALVDRKTDQLRTEIIGL